MKSYLSKKDTAKVIQKAFVEGCLLKMSTTFWGNQVRLKEDEMNDLPTDLVKASKNLIDSDKLKDLRSIRTKARQWAKQNCLPWIDKTIYYLPKSRVDAAIEFLETCQAEQVIAVEDLCSQYDEHKKEMKARIKKANKDNGTNILFDESRYPTKDEIRAKYSINFQLYQLIIPDEVLGKVQANKEQEKLNEEIKASVELGILTVRKAFVEMVQHLRDRLINGQSFKNASVNNLKSFLNDFNELNIWNDKELKNLISKCSKYLDGVDPDALRDDESFATTVGSNMDVIIKDVKGLKDEKLERAIDF